MPSRRDPVSTHFDPGAEHLLTRAAAAGRGNWVTTRLIDPTPRQVRRWQMSDGIDVTGPDPVPAGGLNARSRWGRAFVRSLYHLNKQGARSALEVEIGRHVPASPGFDPDHPAAGGFPPGRQVRIRFRQGGKAALAAVRRLPDSARIYNDDGSTSARWADASVNRDWA